MKNKTNVIAMLATLGVLGANFVPCSSDEEKRKEKFNRKKYKSLNNKLIKK